MISIFIILLFKIFENDDDKVLILGWMFIFVMIINVVANAFKALVSSVSEFKPFLMNALKNAFANKIKVEIAKIK